MDRASATIPKLLARAATQFGARPAVIGPGISMSYRELHARVLKAAALLASSGVAKGDRVAIWLPNGIEFIETALATAFVGASTVPLNTRLKGPEVAYILNKARPKVVVSVGQFLGADYGDILADEHLPEFAAKFRVGAGRSDWIPWSDAVTEVSENGLASISEIGASVEPDEIAEIMFTSGTTGFPKGTMLRHSQIVQAYSFWARQLGITSEDRYFVIAPMFHSYGFKAGVLACVATGAATYPLATFDVARALDIIERDRITVMGGPPTIFLSLLAENKSLKKDISSLRSISMGGSVIPTSLVRTLQGMGVEIVATAYGLTEATALVTMTLPDDAPEVIASTCGRAIPGVEVRCMDANGAQVPVGEAGEIQVRGFDVMAGYFEDAEATRNAMTSDGWLRTGDIGSLDAQGYLKVTDRIKDMFIVGGFNCFPAEIERIILECPLVAQVAVIGIPDDRMGEVGKAFVVPKAPSTFAPEEFLVWCRQNMANYKVPRQVEVLDVLPRNAMGKVQKFILRDGAARA